MNPFAIPGLGSGSGSGAASDGGGMGNMNSLLGILGSLNNGGPSSGVPANPFLPASSSSTTAAATQQQQGMSDLLRALIIQRQLQQAAGGGGVGGGVNPFPNPFATLPINPFLPSSSSLSSSLAASATAPPPIDAEERYSNQLQSMAEMGFTEREKNLRALIATVSRMT